MNKKIEKVYFWPTWFYHDRLEIKNKINKSVLSSLGRANLDLWQALNIYDDFLDQEGCPANLPLGNKHYRNFLTAYYELPLPAAFYNIFRQILDNLDRANRREVLHYRGHLKNEKITYPKRLPSWRNIENLSDKSLALALGAIALICLSGGHKKNQINNKNKIAATVNFFRQALTAKQLADDACDWREDLSKGRLTPANALIIKAARKKNLVLDFKKDSVQANLLFISEASLKISNQIYKSCQKARRAARQAGLKTDGYLIGNIIKPLERAVEETTEFRRLLATGLIKML